MISLSFRRLLCLIPGLLILNTVISCSGSGTAADLERFEFVESHMGSDFRLLFYAESSEVAERAASSAFGRIHDLDRKLSTYREESELNRLSRTAGQGDWIEVSESLFELIRFSLEASGKTDGAFDITTGPLVELWHISRRTERLPDEHVLTEALRGVGYTLIEIDIDRCAVKLAGERMRLESGGIGKGLAVDQALEIILGYGITSVLIDGSGDIVAADPPPGRTGWELIVEVPGPDGQIRQGTLLLSNEAVATSGDLYQYVEIDGIRYSHVIDPSTGLGVTGQQHVTLLAPDALSADVYSTAMVVMGPEKAESFVSARDGFELLYSRIVDEYGVKTWATSGFEHRME